eukprot:6255568-Amphidinium_carterae.1
MGRKQLAALVYHGPQKLPGEAKLQSALEAAKHHEGDVGGLGSTTQASVQPVLASKSSSL